MCWEGGQHRAFRAQSLQPGEQEDPLPDFGRPLGAPGLGGQGQAGRGLTSAVLLQGSAPILVAMVILLNIGVAILFINFFI